MNERRNEARGANEWNEIYGSVGLTAPTRLMELPLNILDPWTDENGEIQPFDSYTPEELQDLAENIQMNGVIQPIHVRPMPNGRFQILSGHNRCAAAKIAGLTVIPALVKQMDDNQAAVIMVDSNLKLRQIILPSNKGKAYKVRMEHLERKAGRPANNGAQVGPHFEDSGIKGKSRDIIAAEVGDSREQVRRYLRLNHLCSDLLELVDNSVRKVPEGQKKLPQIGLTTGVELSYLKMEEQELLVQIMEQKKIRPPSMAQARELRRRSEESCLDNASILAVLRPVKPPKAATSIKLPAERITSFFPQNTSPEDMEAEIYEALLAYRNNKTSVSA